MDKNPAGNIESTLVVLIKDTNHSLFDVTAYHQDTIAVLKAKIQVKTNIPVDQQRLIYAGKTVNDDNTLSVFNIREGEVLHLSLELTGGMGPKGVKNSSWKILYILLDYFVVVLVKFTRLIRFYLIDLT